MSSGTSSPSIQRAPWLETSHDCAPLAAFGTMESDATTPNGSSHNSTTVSTHNRQRRFSTSTPPLAVRTDAKKSNARMWGSSGELERHVLAGLSVAGVAATMLHTAFTYEAEQTALVASINRSHHHHHPYSASGMLLKTASYVLGAWWVDHIATRRKRTDYVGATGVLLAAIFLVLHMSSSRQLWVFECMRSVYILVLASPVIDDHRMLDAVRIKFMASGQAANLFTALALRRILVSLPKGEDYSNIRRAFVLLLVAIVCLLFVVAQNMIAGSQSLSHRRVFSPVRVKEHDEEAEDDPFHHPAHYKRHLELRRVIRDIGRYKSFQMWIGMEILMEAQIALFHVFFLETFVYVLVGGRNEQAAWTVYLTRKFAAIATYLPMMLFGYTGVYKTLFYAVFSLSLVVLVLGDSSSTAMLYILAVVFLVSMVAVHSAGFQLAMADMSMELQHHHSSDGRFDEPSLAGLLIGANALFCKPIAYLMSAVAMRILQSRLTDSNRNVFYLLTITPLVCSGLQLLFWRHYELTPKRTAVMRDEVHRDVDADLPR